MAYITYVFCIKQDIVVMDDNLSRIFVLWTDVWKQIEWFHNIGKGILILFFLLFLLHYTLDVFFNYKIQSLSIF